MAQPSKYHFFQTNSNVSEENMSKKEILDGRNKKNAFEVFGRSSLLRSILFDLNLFSFYRINSSQENDMSECIEINRTWDGKPTETPSYYIYFTMAEENGDMLIDVDAPFFNDPQPPVPVGKIPNTYDYEVVEVFLSGYAEPQECPYLEINIGPYGHYSLAYFMKQGDFGNVDTDLDLETPPDCSIDYEFCRWKARLIIPGHILPESKPGNQSISWKVNAYAIHGKTPEAREYFAYQTVPGMRPYFHQLSSFVPLILYEPKAGAFYSENSSLVESQLAAQSTVKFGDMVIYEGSDESSSQSGSAIEVHIPGTSSAPEISSIPKPSPSPLVTVEQVLYRLRDEINANVELKKVMKDLEELYQKHIQDDEFVLLHGIVWKRKGLSYKRRKLILTSKPRLIYLSSTSGLFKGLIPWTMAKMIKTVKVSWIVFEMLLKFCDCYFV